MENLALRQQLSIYHHTNKRPKIRLRDRFFWIFLSRYWKNWKDAVIIVKPKTVISWQRKGSGFSGPGNLEKEDPEDLKYQLKSETLLRQWPTKIQHGAHRVYMESC